MSKRPYIAQFILGITMNLGKKRTYFQFYLFRIMGRRMLFSSANTELKIHSIQRFSDHNFVLLT